MTPSSPASYTFPMSTTKRLLSLSVGLGLAFATAACVPAFLEKYRKEGAQKREAHGVEPVAASDARHLQSEAPGQAGPSAAPRATIYAVDKTTFRFDLKEGDVWETALDVLMRNYNVTIVDRQSGIITTEWDSYFLERAVYRNRVSLRLARNSRGGVDLIIHNNVERLRDASRATETVGAVWLPADDPANETARIVQNMALLLNQPPPVLPPRSAVARQVAPEPAEAKL